MNQTKIVYFIDNEKIPYSFDLDKSPDQVCLRDFKQKLKDDTTINTMLFVFYFKVIHKTYGELKHLISNDSELLPNIDGIVISWLNSKPTVDADNVEADVNVERSKIKTYLIFVKIKDLYNI